MSFWKLIKVAIAVAIVGAVAMVFVGCGEVVGPSDSYFLASLTTSVKEISLGVGGEYYLEVKANFVGDIFLSEKDHFAIEVGDKRVVEVRRYYWLIDPPEFDPRLGRTNVVRETFVLTGLPTGGFTDVTLWHPQDRRKVEVVKVKVNSSLPPGCTSRSGYSPVTGQPCNGGVTVPGN